MNGFGKMTIGNVWRGTVEHTFNSRSVKGDVSTLQDNCAFSPRSETQLDPVSQKFEDKVYAKEMAQKLVADLRQTKTELRQLQEQIATRIARAIEHTKQSMDRDFSIMLSSCIEAHSREKYELASKLEQKENEVRILKEVNSMTLRDIESRALQKRWRSLDCQKQKRWKRGAAATRHGLKKMREEALQGSNASQLRNICADLFETLCDRNGRLRSSNLRHFLRQKELLGPDMVLGDVDITIQKHSGGRQHVREDDVLSIVNHLVSRRSISSEEYVERMSHLLLIRRQQVNTLL